MSASARRKVALRAAFVAAMNGKQVGGRCPHDAARPPAFQDVLRAFSGLPLNVGQAVALVGSAELARVKAGIKDGTIDIVVGTHALLGKGIEFRDLGL
jgi:transcription-repair coupling factor (superfamily II helicase)